MKLISSAFDKNGNIPIRYTGEGENISPPFTWSDAPWECKSYALICEDFDAPRERGKEWPFVHWLIYNISNKVTWLPEGIPTEGHLNVPVTVTQGRNTFGRLGYSGPLPPLGSEAHRYKFTLYALSKVGLLPSAADRNIFRKYIQGSVITSTELIGKYKRQLGRLVAG